MSGLTLLASYPKSGNTWLRALLDSLMRAGAPVDINGNMASICTAGDRKLFDATMGVDAGDLTVDEIYQARAQLWDIVRRDRPRIRFVKTHDALMPPIPTAGLPFPASAIGAVIYIARDPRDVVLSFAEHFGTTIDEAITWMADEGASLDSFTDRLPEQLPQFMSSWSRHVGSWLDAPDLRRHLLRYEDLQTRPAEALAGVADFLGLDSDADRIARAVEAARFDTLRAQEERYGFRERASQAERFFRQGRTGGWREALSPDQADRITVDHHAAMQRLGYLPIKAAR